MQQKSNSPREVTIKNITIGGNNPIALIAGPCVIESKDHALKTAERLKQICNDGNIDLIYKSSYDKANRSSLSYFRGPGITEGLRILEKVKNEFDLPILSDIHKEEEVEPAAEVLDVLQIPAFLCRQTDLLIKAGNTGKPINVKKGQFMAPWDMKNIPSKLESTGNRNLLLTERGVSFGYNNLVVDMRSLIIMRDLGYPVIFDATHSVQLPGGQGDRSGGQREMAPPLIRGAIAVGCDALFLEVHPDPDNAPSDGPNMIKIDDLPDVIKEIKALDKLRLEGFK